MRDGCLWHCLTNCTFTAGSAIELRLSAIIASWAYCHLLNCHSLSFLTVSPSVENPTFKQTWTMSNGQMGTSTVQTHIVLLHTTEEFHLASQQLGQAVVLRRPDCPAGMCQQMSRCPSCLLQALLGTCCSSPSLNTVLIR